MSNKLNTCAHCGKPAHKKCTRCYSVVYCNRECQRAHFKRHKKVCNQIAAANGAVAGAGAGAGAGASASASAERSHGPNRWNADLVSNQLPPPPSIGEILQMTKDGTLDPKKPLSQLLPPAARDLIDPNERDNPPPIQIFKLSQDGKIPRITPALPPDTPTDNFTRMMNNIREKAKHDGDDVDHGDGDGNNKNKIAKRKDSIDLSIDSEELSTGFTKDHPAVVSKDNGNDGDLNGKGNGSKLSDEIPKVVTGDDFFSSRRDKLDLVLNGDKKKDSKGPPGFITGDNLIKSSKSSEKDEDDRSISSKDVEGVLDLIRRQIESSDDESIDDKNLRLQSSKKKKKKKKKKRRKKSFVDDEDSSDFDDLPELIPKHVVSSGDESLPFGCYQKKGSEKDRNLGKNDKQGRKSVADDQDGIVDIETAIFRQQGILICHQLSANLKIDIRIENSILGPYEEKSSEQLFSSLFLTNCYENKEEQTKQSTKVPVLWSLVETKYTAPILRAFLKKNTNPTIVKKIKSNVNQFLNVICKDGRKDELVQILDLGVTITSQQLVTIFKLLPSNKGDQHNNKIASTIIKKCDIYMNSKNDLIMIRNVINDRIGKHSKKKLLDLAKQGERKLSLAKKAGVQKEIFIEISKIKKEKEKNVVNNVTREENKKAHVKDTFKSKFEKRIVSSLQYYHTLLEEYKSMERDAKKDNDEDGVKESKWTTAQTFTHSTKRLSSKEVVEALTKFQRYSEEEQKEQKNEVIDLEMNMDLSDFNHESEWTIEITEEAHKWFRKHMKRQNGFCQRVIRRLKILSTGRWPYVLCKPLKTKSTDTRLYESKIDSGSRILWEVAVGFSPRRSSPGNPIYEHLIRVWDIVDDHDKLSDRIDLAIDRIAQSRKRGEESCIYSELVVGEDKPLKNKEGIAVPRVFATKNSLRYTSNEAKTPEKGNQKHYPPASHDPNQYTLLKFYQLNSDAIKLLLDSNDDQIDLPFTPGPKEHEIIHHKSNPKRSMLLQGRSGTGKTTCLVFRMWAQYMAYIDKQKGRQLRQLFITKNNVLRNEVEKSFGNMGLAYRKRVNDVDFQQHHLHDDKDDNQDAKDDTRFPLFLTSSEWLDVLDKELPGKCFFTPKETEMRSQSRNFLDGAVERGMQVALSSRNEEAKIEVIRREMDFTTFRKFWPKINARRKTELDPAMVWREIYTYIKGSVRALKLEDDDRDVQTNRYLTYHEYLSLPRKQSRLNREQKEIVFELFQTYEKLKKENYYYDSMDVVYNLAGRARDFSSHQKFHEMNEKLLPIDSLFIDEVQDFTMSELYLVTKLSTDQNNLMLAGDTAQSITEGVAFRFTDVRQIFFELFGGQTPDLLTLDHNYRSHAGILRLAACVVELLYFFFGDSLDKLPPDLGLFDGPKPIVMKIASTKELALMLQGERESSRIEFGAHQVVIVRNESMKDSLVREFDIEREWIMTVQESKGLEFDDVLLYNFFTESDAAELWRIVSNYTKEDVEQYYSEQSVKSSGVAKYEWDDLIKQGRHLEFSEEIHKVLETEMKILYTAITRARVNMFIVETNGELSSPMFTYFKQRKAVQEVMNQTKEGISNIPVFGKMSSKEDWCKQGEAYLRQASGLGVGEQINQRLRLAAKCFEKAGDPKRQKNALAYLKYVEELDNLTQKQEDIRKFPQKRERFYGVATELLEAEDVDFLDKAGLCLFRSGDIEKARSASIFELYGRLSYIRRDDREENAAPDVVEQRNFDYAAVFYEELSMDQTESLLFQRKHLVNAIRTYLSVGTTVAWKKAADLIDSNIDFLKPASKEIKALFTPSKALEQDPLSYLHLQMKNAEKTQFLHQSLSNLP